MNVRVITIALLLATLPVGAQKKKTVVNDSNTPLHLLQPAYQGTYGDLSPEQVKKDIDRVFAYIDKETPARVVDKNTGTWCFPSGKLRMGSNLFCLDSSCRSYGRSTLHGLCAEPFPLSGGSGASF